MKIFQKLSLAVLSSAFLLGGVGVISLRVNSQVKANVEQAVLEASNTNNILADIQAELRRIESKTYHYFWLKKYGIPVDHLEEDKQEILELLPQIEQKLLELDKSAEKLLRFDMNSPEELREEEGENGEPLKNELELIRIADKLQEKNSQIHIII